MGVLAFILGLLGSLLGLGFGAVFGQLGLWTCRWRRCRIGRARLPSFYCRNHWLNGLNLHLFGYLLHPQLKGEVLRYLRQFSTLLPEAR